MRNASLGIWVVGIALAFLPFVVVGIINFILVGVVRIIGGAREAINPRSHTKVR